MPSFKIYAGMDEVKKMKHLPLTFMCPFCFKKTYVYKDLEVETECKHFVNHTLDEKGICVEFRKD